MSDGYNLPESTGPNDPEAPWNQTYDDDTGLVECEICGELLPEDELDGHVCFSEGEDDEEV